jgi:cobalt-zinc-cadmium efflux system membrane fusion protein
MRSRFFRSGAGPATVLACCTALSACGGAPGVSTKSASARPTDATVVVKAAQVTRQLTAYAQVRPIVPVRVRAAEAGAIMATRVLPGASVRAGEVLATLGGPQVDALMARRQAAVSGARARSATARHLLAIARQRFALDLDTRQAVLVAQSDFATARAQLLAATAAFRAANALRKLRAPADGRVLAVDVADGERVSVGQTVLTLFADEQLWVRASYYGADAGAIHVGMTGVFRPSAGASPVPVRVVAVAASQAADGGEAVGLAEVHGAGASQRPNDRWIAGERGVVTIDAGRRSMIAVPTDALVLDQARWFVLVETPNGIERRKVVPGPVHGWQTFVAGGLHAGDRVLAQNAYLEFHRDIAAHYTPPD